MNKVISGAIKAIGYDAERQDMDIQFKSGETYTYNPITQKKYNNFLNAESLGAHFYRNIKTMKGITVKKLV